MADILQSLATIIVESVSVISLRCTETGKHFPTLDEEFTDQSQEIRSDGDVESATIRIVAAAAQLIATVRPPSLTLLDRSTGFLLSSALSIASRTCTAEVLREAGAEGRHINAIGREVGVEPSKLGQILRALATHHIFREVSPDVFANNQISSLLDTGKDSHHVLSRPVNKFVGARGYSAMVECFTDEVFRSATAFSDTILEASTQSSGNPTESAFNRAFSTDLEIFSWYESPENRDRLVRFSMAMDGARRLSPPKAILRGFDWSTLPAGSCIVDVGGGVGSTTLEILHYLPSLKAVVQDRPAVIILAKEYWQSHLPHALFDKRVHLQVHDFFTPQPITDAAIFLLRMVLHDWSDSYALKILKHLRAAASQHTRLMVIEHILAYTCRQSSSSVDEVRGISGGAIDPAPTPLLANFGLANSRVHLADLQLSLLMNGQERTLDQYCSLFIRSGWKMERVYRVANAPHQQMIAVPSVI
ncbi:O-methyltransferase [Amylostereum chailletii]|nr:O-methyltransferase [Amylostereum chailletii]